MHSPAAAKDMAGWGSRSERVFMELSQSYPGATEPSMLPPALHLDQCSLHWYLQHPPSQPPLAGEQSNLSPTDLPISAPNFTQDPRPSAAVECQAYSTSNADCPPRVQMPYRSPKACWRDHEPNKSSLDASEQLGKLTGTKYPG